MMKCLGLVDSSNRLSTAHFDAFKSTIAIRWGVRSFSRGRHCSVWEDCGQLRFSWLDPAWGRELFDSEEYSLWKCAVDRIKTNWEYSSMLTEFLSSYRRVRNNEYNRWQWLSQKRQRLKREAILRTFVYWTWHSRCWSFSLWNGASPDLSLHPEINENHGFVSG